MKSFLSRMHFMHTYFAMQTSLYVIQPYNGIKTIAIKCIKENLCLTTTKSTKTFISYEYHMSTENKPE